MRRDEDYLGKDVIAIEVQGKRRIGRLKSWLDSDRADLR